MHILLLMQKHTGSYYLTTFQFMKISWENKIKQYTLHSYFSVQNTKLQLNLQKIHKKEYSSHSFPYSHQDACSIKLTSFSSCKRDLTCRNKLVRHQHHLAHDTILIFIVCYYKELFATLMTAYFICQFLSACYLTIYLPMQHMQSSVT